MYQGEQIKCEELINLDTLETRDIILSKNAFNELKKHKVLAELEADDGIRYIFMTKEQAKEFKYRQTINNISMTTELDKYKKYTSFYNEEEKLKYKDMWVARIAYFADIDDVIEAKKERDELNLQYKRKIEETKDKEEKEKLEKELVSVLPRTIYGVELIIAIETSEDKVKEKAREFVDKVSEASLDIPRILIDKFTDGRFLSSTVRLSEVDYYNTKLEKLIGKQSEKEKKRSEKIEKEMKKKMERSMERINNENDKTKPDYYKKLKTTEMYSREQIYELRKQIEELEKLENESLKEATKLEQINPELKDDWEKNKYTYINENM